MIKRRQELNVRMGRNEQIQKDNKKTGGNRKTNM